MGKAAHAQAGRDRVRDVRLRAARERRLNLDRGSWPEGGASTEASIDLEVAWEERAQAAQAVVDAEVAAAIERLCRSGSPSRKSCI